MEEMEKTLKKHFTLVAVGLLAMNACALANLLLHANIDADMIDFMKGLGLPLIVAGAFPIIKNKARTQ